MFRARSLCKLLIALLIVLAIPACYAEDDPHLGGALGDFFAHCPFAHGYVHGYEEGFHIGDADFHLGRERADRAVLQARRNNGYRTTFGNHDSYRFGYREGLLAGYNDSITGREFRAYEELRTSRPAAQSMTFSELDRGFGIGYSLGHLAGSRSLDSDGDFDAEPAPCPAHAAADGTLPPQSAAYCDGFAKAYVMGYRDAYLTRDEQATQVAAKK